MDVPGHQAPLRTAAVAMRAAMLAVTLAAGLLAAPGPAAQAQPQSNLQLAGIGNVELRVGGGDQNVRIEVQNRGDAPAVGVRLTMTVPLREFGVHISSAPGECNRSNDNTRMDCLIPEIGPGGTHQILAQVAVPGNSPLEAGETRNGPAEVVLDGGRSQSFNVRLQGPDRPPGVPEVSGFVTDEATGERISGANVLLVDSQNVELTTTTDGNGNFRFAGEQIAPGSIGLQASKEGYEGQQFVEQARAGEPLTGVQLTVRNTASPTPSASATPTPTPTATATASPTAVAAAADESGGGSAFTTFMIIVGLLFVLLGIGAIVLLIIRRRREQRGDGGPDGADYPTSGPRGPGPRPGSHGVYRPAPANPTQVIGGRGVPAVGPSAALADAPTAMQPRGGGSDQTTMIPPQGGAADQTAMIPRAGDPRSGAGDPRSGPLRPGEAPLRAGEGPPPRPGEPPGPRPPALGGAPPPRPAAPTYGTPDAPTYAGPDPHPYGSPAGPAGYQSAAGQQPAAGYHPSAGYHQPSPGHQPSGGYQPGAEHQPGAGYQPGTDYQPGAGYQPSTEYQPGAGYQPPAGQASGGYGGSYGPDPYTRPAPPQPASPPPPPPAAGYRPPGPSGADGYSEPGYYQQPPPYRGEPDRSGARHHAAEPSGYDQPGYGGYDRPGHDQPDYDQSGYRGGDYYDEAGQPRGRHAEPPPERRRLDWLDDT